VDASSPSVTTGPHIRKEGGVMVPMTLRAATLATLATVMRITVENRADW